MSGLLERGQRGLRRATVLGGMVAAFAATPATPAEAAFSLPACGGSAILGQGSSLQAAAQGAWKSGFFPGVCASFPSQPISYDPAGSGQGRRAFGARTGTNPDGSHSRDQAARYAASDEPLTATDRAQIEQGTDAAGDESKVHEIPVAAAAIAVIVHFPDACNLGSVPAGNQSDSRVRFTKAQLELVFNGGSDADLWGKVFPTITPTGPTCRDLAITRVVRKDGTGATYAFKSFLNAIYAGRGWLTTYSDTSWPTPGTLTIPTSAGADSVADTVNATNGSIGYVDLATARSKGFTLDTMATSPPDTTYWIQVPNGQAAPNDLSPFVDPASDSASFKTLVNPVKGANCTQATYSNVPATTFGDWSQVAGVNAQNGYGICMLTYDLAFDDYATAYSAYDPSAEQAKARTVKDYLTYVVSDAGQAKLQPNDYANVPSTIQAISQAGVAGIGWNKAGGPGPGPGPGPSPGPAPGLGPGGTLPVDSGNPPAPSNAFTISSVSVGKRGKVSVRLQLPGAGKVVLNASGKSIKFRRYKAKTISRAGTASLSTAGGVAVVTFTPSSAVTSALKHGQKVNLTMGLTFTPAGGSANTLTRTLTLKPKKLSKTK